jgi:hypothetical protein
MMGFVMLAMMIMRVIMTPRMTLVVGMLMTALLASIGYEMRQEPHEGRRLPPPSGHCVGRGLCHYHDRHDDDHQHNATTLPVPHRRTAVTIPVNASIKMIVVLITLMATAIIRSLRESPRGGINRITSTSISTQLDWHRGHCSRSILASS